MPHCVGETSIAFRTQFRGNHTYFHMSKASSAAFPRFPISYQFELSTDAVVCVVLASLLFLWWVCKTNSQW